MDITAAVLTVSDAGARGERVDTAGPAVAEMLRARGIDVRESRIVADERVEIEERLRYWADESGFDVVVTAGGTGLAPRDVTPEATRRMIDREVPGMAEVMRQAGLQSTPMAALSRGVVGTRKRTLIINLPGSEKGARESLEAVLNLIPHAVELLRGGRVEQHPA